jgi:hypothetical protein
MGMFGNWDKRTKCPEALAADEWWRSTGNQTALCDDCMEKLKRGEGYVVEGTVWVLGEGADERKLIDESGSLLCEECFRRRKKDEAELLR